ncbi:MAG: N-acetyltransferase family protein [Anaerolineae bacterium]
MKTYRATLEHLEPVADLFDQYRQFYEQEPNLEGCREYIRSRLTNDESVIFVAEDNTGTIVGFTQMYRSFCSVEMKQIIYLYDLFVAPAVRKQGVGRLLMNTAKEFSEGFGASRMTLETGIDNHPGQALYESLGYKRNTEFYAYDLGLD